MITVTITRLVVIVWTSLYGWNTLFYKQHFSMQRYAEIGKKSNKC